MKIKILKRDFDKAMSVPWDTHTCLVAQALHRTFGSSVKKGFGGASNMTLNNGKAFDITNGDAVELQNQFDSAFKHQGVVDSLALDLLRAALPMSCEIQLRPQ